ELFANPIAVGIVGHRVDSVRQAIAVVVVLFANQVAVGVISVSGNPGYLSRREEELFPSQLALGIELIAVEEFHIRTISNGDTQPAVYTQACIQMSHCPPRLADLAAPVQ